MKRARELNNLKLTLYITLWIVALIILFECVLRLSGFMRTYSEITGEGFQTNYDKILPSWYPSWTADTSFELNRGEHQYTYSTNSLGIREQEIPLEKNDTPIRIIALGDSFAEGMGAPADSTWPRMLQVMLNESGYSVQVFNAGVSGSNPFFAHYLLRDKLLQYKPDMVLFSVNSTDLFDYLQKGGYESFHTDSTIHYRKSPWYMPLYQYSHLARALLRFGFNYPVTDLFITRSEFRNASVKAVESIYSVLRDSEKMMKENKIIPVFIVHPTPAEAVTPHPELSYYPGTYMNMIDSLLEKQNFHVLNLYDSFNQLINDSNMTDYAYKNDGHFNPRGYYFFAQNVCRYLDTGKIFSIKY